MVRIAYVIDRKYFERKMSRGARFHSMLALGRRDDVELVWCGNGWPEATGDFDLLVFYKPADHPQWLARSEPKASVYNECWWPDRAAEKECLDAGIDYVFCHHENDLKQFDHSKFEAVVHVPHCAERLIFSPIDQPTVS